MSPGYHHAITRTSCRTELLSLWINPDPWMDTHRMPPGNGYPGLKPTDTARSTQRANKMRSSEGRAAPAPRSDGGSAIAMQGKAHCFDLRTMDLLEEGTCKSSRSTHNRTCICFWNWILEKTLTARGSATTVASYRLDRNGPTATGIRLFEYIGDEEGK